MPMPYFICPKCAWRGTEVSRTSGFSDQPAGCEKCGFGFLFEMLEDYYPSPLAGIFVCDKDARILAFGKDASRLCGFEEEELLGVDIEEALELRQPGSDERPHAKALEWGARMLNRSMTFRSAEGIVVAVTGDFFPAYDDDGGLLVVLTPRTV